MAIDVKVVIGFSTEQIDTLIHLLDAYYDKIVFEEIEKSNKKSNPFNCDTLLKIKYKFKEMKEYVTSIEEDIHSSKFKWESNNKDYIDTMIEKNIEFSLREVAILYMFLDFYKDKFLKKLIPVFEKEVKKLSDDLYNSYFYHEVRPQVLLKFFEDIQQKLLIRVGINTILKLIHVIQHEPQFNLNFK